MVNDTAIGFYPEKKYMMRKYLLMSQLSRSLT